MKIFVHFISLTVFFLLLSCFNLQGQENNIPKSFAIGDLSMQIPQMTMPPVHHGSLLAEDAENEKNGQPLRVGIIHQVDYTMDNIGRTDYLDDGSKFWRASFYSPGAYGISVQISNFNIPDGAELFVYTPNQQIVDGSYTNKTDLQGYDLFSEDLFGDEIIVEYFEPAGAASNGSFTIAGVGHLYKQSMVKMDNMSNASGNCHINVMCPEVEPWMDQVNGVVHLKLLSSEGVYLCSGSMINNAREDRTPYVLTAAHCFKGYDVPVHFYFNYQTTTCEGTTGISNQRVMNGVIRAVDHAGGNSMSGGPDFMLMEMTGTISNVIKEKLFFAGWDRSAAVPSVGSGIHHPAGDFKKYSLPRSYSSAGPYYWQVNWYTGTANKGVTEGGSSGSPLFNGAKKIVGILSRGASACDNTAGADYYGKFSASWVFNSNDSAKMLRCWLDPDNTGVATIDGMYFNDTITPPEPPDSTGINNSVKAIHNIDVYPNPSSGSFTVKGNFKGASLTCNVYNILGTLVHSEIVGISNEFKLNLNLTNGVYFIKVEDSQRTYTSKLVISK